MQKGFENEKKFAKIIDNKRVNQLSSIFKDILYSLFTDVNENDYVECWQSKYYEKADIKLRINDEIKGISIKSGKYCSMHQEATNTFYPFLKKIGIDNRIIDKFEMYMQGFVKGKRVDAITYIFNNYKDIQKISEKFNEYYIKTNLILRFIFLGTEKQSYGCDAIIYGTPDNFLWATKNEILEYLINYQKGDTVYIKFSAFNIKNYDRNLRNNHSRISKQKDIQVKWYTIKEDLKNIEKIRKSTLKIKF